jgi:hypothetical protein
MYEKERRRVVDHYWREGNQNEVSISGWKGGARIVSQGHRHISESKGDRNL